MLNMRNMTNGNKGFSLVEILVALAIGTVLLASVASLIMISLQIYANVNANAEIENESQRVMNLVTDTIMSAEGVWMKIPPQIDADTSGDTQHILLGELRVDERVEGAGIQFTVSIKDQGMIISYVKNNGTEDVNEMYLTKVGSDTVFNQTVQKEVSPNYYALAQITISGTTPGKITLADKKRGRTQAIDEGFRVMDTFLKKELGIGTNQGKPWLMGSFVDAFSISLPNKGEELKEKEVEYINSTPDSEKEYEYSFQEPLTLHVTFRFQYDMARKSISRELEDNVTVRNRLQTIWVSGVEKPGEQRKMGDWIEYRRR